MESKRAAPPSQQEVEHSTAKPGGKSAKGSTAYNTLTRWITGAASTSKNLNSDPAGASTAGDSSQNLTKVVAGGSSGEPGVVSGWAGRLGGEPATTAGRGESAHCWCLQHGSCRGRGHTEPSGGSSNRRASISEVATENFGSTTEKRGPEAKTGVGGRGFWSKGRYVFQLWICPLLSP
ncbi:hypothetical protein TSAR_014430 [Trichomalopsis sarcophagae]|uniref:Uncharacterized protein n=1 Tax=Trichomalopsis sarcophagae TaxID=543379 RepID=A0A232FDZ1_9HYME|nr:hypothetical protein TSAR_014430 [Trichomalopsis sarcophagae]